MSAPATWQAAREVLCIRLDGMGDLLMTTPAIRALSESGHERRITLLTSPGAAETARNVPEIDEVIVYDAPWMKATAPRTVPAPDLGMIDTLRARAFDAAAIFTVYSQNPLPPALLAYYAGIPLRLAHCHENPYQLLTDWVQDPEPQGGIRHEVQRQLDLVAAIGSHASDTSLSFHVPEDSCRRAAWMLLSAGIDLSRPWVAVHPGATAASRRYPVERFASVVDRLVRDLGLQVVLTGSADERPLVDELADLAAVPVARLAGNGGVAELAALLSMARVVVSNNTGPAHLAAAVGTPIVDLYALTNPQHTPWGVPSRVLFHDVPCKFCYRSVCPEGHHACLAEIPPDAVVDAVRELMADQQPDSSGPSLAAMEVQS